MAINLCDQNGIDAIDVSYFFNPFMLFLLEMLDI